MIDSDRDGADTQEKFRADYQPPEFSISHADLEFRLDAESTTVRSRLSIRRREIGSQTPLVLDGEGLQLLDIRIDDSPLETSAYQLDDATLTIQSVANEFVLETTARIEPVNNTALEGLYKSGDVLTTQCEANGFHRITWFLDRPDVLSTFRVRLIANQDRYPVLLSNGNPVGTGLLEDGQHWADWEDPFPKPCYLFAVVAGRLSEVRATHLRASGTPVTVSVYVLPGFESRAFHARDALLLAMAWDERKYGLECDVDNYAMVSVPDFNMGAMENKGLNIFNDSCLLADYETATDADYERILAVVAHEYFHNWTGNRVTCRDWFQLSLKESLTVFREQQFMEDTLSAGVQRIQNVRMLRSHQFPEDAGPLAHPVRPESYVEMNNFYTLTIYEKGAEIIRMLCTLVGWPTFRKGVQSYLKEHDGSAATIDEFVQAIASASGRDLTQFMRWYSQAGTPEVTLTESFDPSAKRFSLEFVQHTPSTPGQVDKQPLHIPIRYAMFDQAGTATLHGQGSQEINKGVFELVDTSGQLILDDVRGRPVVSVLQGFSAPIKFNKPLRASRIRAVFALDEDPFSRWDALQLMYRRCLLDDIEGIDEEERLIDSNMVISTVRAALEHMNFEPEFLALLLTLPDENELADSMSIIDVDGIVTARDRLRQQLANSLHEHWIELLHSTQHSGEYRFEGSEIGRRALRGVSLQYRVLGGADEGRADAAAMFDAADNMTDSMAALSALNLVESDEKSRCMAAFAERWANEPLVMDKWFSLQALAPRQEAVGHVASLLKHPAFEPNNPNRVRALLGGFTRNLRGFNEVTGTGYQLTCDQISRLDAVNPQVAARLVGAFSNWRRMDAVRSGMMSEALQYLLSLDELSPNCREMVVRSLASD